MHPNLDDHEERIAKLERTFEAAMQDLHQLGEGQTRTNELLTEMLAEWRGTAAEPGMRFRVRQLERTDAILGKTVWIIVSTMLAAVTIAVLNVL